MEILNVPQDQQMEALYSMMGQYPNYLDGLTLVNTPLHYAAAHGRTLLAVEILQRSPPLGFKLNPDGLSPLHLATIGGHLETVRSLIRFSPELIGVQGREGITPLHQVVELENTELLAEFLVTFPDAINELTIRGESAVHLAVKHKKLDSFLVLLGWLRRTGRKNVLQWGDWKDNTLLHAAAETNQTEVIRILIKERVPLNNKNSDWLLARDITTDDSIKQMLLKKGAKEGNHLQDPNYSDYFKQELTFWEKLLRLTCFLEIRLNNQNRNTILIVATLICTATFQAVVNPPTKLSSNTTKVYFAGWNTLSFVASTTMIHILLPSRIYNCVLYSGLYFFMISYLALLSNIGEQTYLLVVLGIPFIIIHLLKIYVTLARDPSSSIRDASPFMKRSSMIIRCVQMDISNI